jgi:hypothetical protein
MIDKTKVADEERKKEGNLRCIAIIRYRKIDNIGKKVK